MILNDFLPLFSHTSYVQEKEGPKPFLKTLGQFHSLTTTALKKTENRKNEGVPPSASSFPWKFAKRAIPPLARLFR